jgi:hypothetical protein
MAKLNQENLDRGLSTAINAAKGRGISCSTDGSGRCSTCDSTLAMSSADLSRQGKILIHDQISDYIEDAVEPVNPILLHVLTDLREEGALTLVNGDEEVRAEKDIEVVEHQLLITVEGMFKHCEDVALVLVDLGTLRTMATVLNL